MGSRCDVGRIALDAEQELRADQNPLDRLLNAGIEAGFRLARRIEGHQAFDIRIIDRPPVCAALNA